MLLARKTGNQSAQPGPGAYDTRSSLGGPSWTLKSRHEARAQPEGAPYRSLPSTLGNCPKIALASRMESRVVNDTPGPAYIPPPLGHDSKKATMSYRHRETQNSSVDNPGPGAYCIESSFAKDARKCTLHGRTSFGSSGADTSSPGPGAYYPDINSTKRRAPSSSLHGRPKDATCDISPGPSDYNVSRNLGGTAPTFHGRPKDLATYSTPGPGAYNPTNMNNNNAPSFTFKSRHEVASRPITVQYRTLPTTIGQGPKIALASRHEARTAIDTPGPSYVPPQLGSDAKMISLASRMAGTRDSRADNPGPGAYDVRSSFGKDARSATLHSRTSTNEGKGNIGPGPGAYYPQIENRAPSATMHIRTALRSAEETPGYCYYGSTLQGPKFSIGRKENIELIQV